MMRMSSCGTVVDSWLLLAGILGLHLLLLLLDVNLRRAIWCMTLTTPSCMSSRSSPASQVHWLLQTTLTMRMRMSGGRDVGIRKA
jgi:hypothetical protein